MENAMLPEHLPAFFTAACAITGICLGLLPFYSKYVIRSPLSPIEIGVTVFTVVGSAGTVVALFFYSVEWVQEALRAHFLVYFAGMFVIMTSPIAVLAALHYLRKEVTKLQT